MPVRFDAATVVLLSWALVVAPLLAWRGARRVASGKPLAPKLKRLRRSSLLLAIAGLFAGLAASNNAIDLRIHWNADHVILGAALAVLLVLAASRGLKKLTPEVIAVRQKLNWPENIAEYRWVVLLSVAAGVGEELVYRGALYRILLRLTSSMALAVLISIVVFGLAHMTYGRKAVIAITYIGLVLHLLYLLSGNLLLTIVLHTLYDIGIFSVVYYKHRSGYFEQRLAPPAGATTSIRVTEEPALALTKATES